MKKQLLIIISLSIFSITQAQTMGTMTDPRDGQTYKTVTYEGELLGKPITTTWMAQNLNYKTSGSYAYEENESYRKVIGLLYTWQTAKKACPKGWHLPSKGEWDTLVDKFGGEDKAGKALKSKKGWNNNGNGDNSSGFGALPAGFRYYDGTFDSLGKSTSFWSSTSSSDTWNSRGYYLYYDNSKVFRNVYDKSNPLSCRCVRD